MKRSTFFKSIITGIAVFFGFKSKPFTIIENKGWSEWESKYDPKNNFPQEIKVYPMDNKHVHREPEPDYIKVDCQTN